MRRLAGLAACLPLVTAVAACAGLTQLQASLGDFDKGAHEVATSEMSFLRAAQSADCTKQFYQGAILWALDAHAGELDLSKHCTPVSVSTTQIQTRQALLNAITLYADKISALAADGQDKALDAGARTMAGRLEGLSAAKLPGLGGLSLGDKLPTRFSGDVAAGVAAAIDEMAQMALDRKRYKDIKDAAGQMQPHLALVVAALQAENALYAQSIASSLGDIQQNLQLFLKESRDARVRLVARSKASYELLVAGKPSDLSDQKLEGNIALLSFADVVTARQILRDANPFGDVGLIVPAGADEASKDAQSLAARVNGSLDALLRANDAIANAGNGGIIASVNDLIARAQDAQKIAAAIGK
jgi:hypothetical protein